MLSIGAYVIVKEVKYDQVHLKVGDEVERVDQWRVNTEGVKISLFKTKQGELIPLLFDEVEQKKINKAK